jgi:DNA mismatch endonuclease, patch repair protein
MADSISSKHRSWNMSRIRSTNTKPEIIVRSLLHSLGFRFRKNVKTLPGKPDVVLKKYNAIIFVHGCFWHQHKNCKRSNMPKSRQDYWKSKLGKNVLCDELHNAELKKQGWRILIVWECEVKEKMFLTDKLKTFLLEN